MGGRGPEDAGTELRHRVGLESVGHGGGLCFADKVQVALGVVEVDMVSVGQGSRQALM